MYSAIAILLALMAVLSAYLVTDRVFEHLAHLEDEQAFVWQAAVIANGKLTLPSPPSPDSFLWPFVIDYQGQRFGKYPLGWSAILSIGYLLEIRSLVNPLLAGLGIWLTYLLGKRIFGPITGLLAAGLTLVSPFFLMISGSLLSHPLGLVLSAAFALCWLAAFTDPPGTPAETKDSNSTVFLGENSQATGALPHDLHHRKSRMQWLTVTGAGLALGALALTRPWTAVGVALPFVIHALFILIRGSNHQRRMLLVLAGIALVVSSLHFAWQWRATGNPLQNPYTLWWSYDKIGFGPGHGVSETGHTLHKAISHVRYSFRDGFPDLFGWKSFSWLFIPFGILAAWMLCSGKRLQALLVGSVIASLVLVHLAYWVGSYILGPRYYYEGLYSLTIFSAAGIVLLGGWSIPDSRSIKNPFVKPGAGIFAALSSRKFTRLRSILVVTLVAGLVLYNLFVYLPDRLAPLHGLYGVSRTHLADFLNIEDQGRSNQSARINMGIFRQLDLKPAILQVVDPISGEFQKVNTPALVIVHFKNKWIEYGTLLELQIGDFSDGASPHPFLDAPFIFAISRGEQEDEQLASSFPDRNVIHYYPKETIKFLTQPVMEP